MLKLRFENMGTQMCVDKTRSNYRYNFITIIFSRFISSFGTSVLAFAFSLYILDMTDSAVKFSMVVGLNMLSGAVFKIIGGVLVDRFDKKIIMVNSNILSGIFILIFMFLFALKPKSFLLVIVYNILIPIVQSCFIIVCQASIPNIVTKNQVVKVNSSFQIMESAKGIAGPVLGALAYKGLGMKSIFLICAVCLFTAGIVQIFLKFNAVDSVKQEGDGNIIKSMASAINYVKSERMIRNLLLFAVIVQFFFRPVFSVVVPFISYKVIQVTGIQLSVIQAAGAGGILIGALVLLIANSENQLLKSFFGLLEAQAILIMSWAIIYFVFKLSAMDSKWMITIAFAGILLLIDALNTIQNVPVFTYMQLAVPGNLRGRVFALAFGIMEITVPVGMWIYGLVLNNFYWVYLPISAGVLIIMICFFARKKLSFKDYVITEEKN